MSLINTLKYKIRCTWKGYFREQAIKKCQAKIISYYSSHPSSDSETGKAVQYISTHPICTFPDQFMEKYKSIPITVYRDSGNGLLYVLHEGKKLYFKRSYNERTVKSLYRGLLTEQDVQSPHCYTSNRFTITTGDVFFDIGSAEAIIPLTHIEKTSHVVLFEKDKEWHEALEATFAPWKKKVTIVARYVSDRDDEDFISIDSFLKTYPHLPNFIKIDVEGAEATVLNGMKQLTEHTHSLKIALCTYHQAEDYQRFTRLFGQRGDRIEASPGVMLFLNDLENLQPPYFRKGLIRITTK